MAFLMLWWSCEDFLNLLEQILWWFYITQLIRFFKVRESYNKKRPRKVWNFSKSPGSLPQKKIWNFLFISGWIRRFYFRRKPQKSDKKVWIGANAPSPFRYMTLQFQCTTTIHNVRWDVFSCDSNLTTNVVCLCVCPWSLPKMNHSQ